MKGRFLTAIFFLIWVISFYILLTEKVYGGGEEYGGDIKDAHQDSGKHYLRKYIPYRYQENHHGLNNSGKEFNLQDDKEHSYQGSHQAKDEHLIVPSLVFPKDEVLYGGEGEDLDWGYDGVGGSTGALSRFNHMSGFDSSYHEE